MHNPSMIYGYARVSSNGQDLAQQLAQLEAAGCTKVYREKVSAATPGEHAIGDNATSRILAFLEQIGIAVVFEPTPVGAVLPDMAVRNGTLVVDLDRLRYPGDMLHEAGHIAVTDPALRPTLCEVSSDPAEEMATIAWSYAAALAAGIDPAVVFHADGYAKAAGRYVGGDYLVQAFTNGGTIGQPMLHLWGMCTDGNIDKTARGPVFPEMKRWLR